MKKLLIPVFILTLLIIPAALAADYTPCDADFNTDGKVDFSDFIAFAADYSCPDASKNPPCTSNWKTYDIDSDNTVGFNDFLIFAPLYGEECLDDDDNDSVLNDDDNCPDAHNPDQNDWDRDGIGDACDDSDMLGAGTRPYPDGIVDSEDNCPSIWNPDQTNTDNDYWGDICDNCFRVPNDDQRDNDRDGWGDACDNCPNVNDPTLANYDGDSFGDKCDNDIDNDGIPNKEDTCPRTPLGAEVETTGRYKGCSQITICKADNDESGRVSYTDTTRLQIAVNQGNKDLRYDINNDRKVNQDDVTLSDVLDAASGIPAAVCVGNLDDDGDKVKNKRDLEKNTPPCAVNFGIDEFGRGFDTDKDGKKDGCDNCRLIPNSDQADDDKDGLGNVCDNCWAVKNPDQQDKDGDCSPFSQPYALDPKCGDVCDECPSDPGNSCDRRGSAGSSIGTSGGTVANQLGTAKVEIPPYALSGDTSISITSYSPSQTGKGFVIENHKFTVFGNVYKFLPDGISFSKQVTITLKYEQGSMEECGMDENGFDIYRWDGTKWVVKPAEQDCSTNTLTIATDQFSFYVIASSDTDGDGIPNSEDDCPNTPLGEINKINSDGCSCSDLQVDDNNDCTIDSCENGIISRTSKPAGTSCGFARNCPDDGCSGEYYNYYPSDGHDTCNSEGRCEQHSCSAYSSYYDSGCDDDDDNDGVKDNRDNCPNNYNPNQEDNDGDGKGNVCDNCPDNYNPNQEDLDNDGTGDACDSVDNRDNDNDNIINSNDNCPNNYNPNQEDIDGDGTGDACDSEDDRDNDGDGVTNHNDNCPDNHNPNQEDTDGDGIGDACDSVDNKDNDNDGIINSNDNCPDNYNPNQENNDNDSQGDVCDPDDDNDGINDGSDNCPNISNPNQEDHDGDNIGDACDSNNLPEAQDSQITTNEDFPYTFKISDFNYYDFDNNPISAVKITSTVAKGYLKKNGVNVANGNDISAGDITNNKLVFSTDTNENGLPYTTFQFKVFDGTEYSASAYTMTIRVNPDNDPPVISNVDPPTDDNPATTDVTIIKGQTQEFSLTATDVDSSITKSWKIDGTEVSTASSYSFTPGLEHIGSRTLVFSVNDEDTTLTQTWNINVITIDLEIVDSSVTLNTQSENAKAMINNDEVPINFKIKNNCQGCGSQTSTAMLFVDSGTGFEEVASKDVTVGEGTTSEDIEFKHKFTAIGTNEVKIAVDTLTGEEDTDNNEYLTSILIKSEQESVALTISGPSQKVKDITFDIFVDVWNILGAPIYNIPVTLHWPAGITIPGDDTQTTGTVTTSERLTWANAVGTVLGIQTVYADSPNVPATADSTKDIEIVNPLSPVIGPYDLTYNPQYKTFDIGTTFDVTTIIDNSGTEVARDLQLELTLPEGIETDDDTSITIAELGIEETINLAWSMTVTGEISGDFELTVLDYDYDTKDSEDPDDPPTDPPVDPPQDPPQDPPTDPPADPPQDPPVDPPQDPPADPPTDPPQDPPVDPPQDPPADPPTDPPTDPPQEEEKKPSNHKYTPYFNGILIDNDFLKAGEETSVSMRVKNPGSRTMKNVRISITAMDFDLRESTGTFKINGHDTATKRITLHIPEDLEPGEYPIRFSIYADGNHVTKYRPIMVE